MGVRYDSGERLLGLPMTRYRDVVAGWGRSRSVEAVAAVRRHGLTPEEVAVCIDDAGLRGLVAGPGEGYVPSRAGIALIGATPLKPIPAARGHEILGDLLRRAGEVNDRDDLPFCVERIWLYGSLARGEPEVNDVDVVVEVRHDMSILFDPERGSRLIEMATEMGGGNVIRRRMGALGNAMQYVRNRMLYGDRRNPRLSVGVLDELVDMDRPCRLVFDIDLDGPCDEPLLDRHPDCKGRCPTMPEPGRLPDLRAVTPPTPVALDLALQVALVPTGESGLREIVGQVSVTSSTLEHGPLAGWIRERAGGEAIRLGKGVAIVVERSMGDAGYVMSVVDGVAMGRPSPSHEELDALAHVLASAVNCDMRKAEMRGDGEVPTVTIEMQGGPSWAAILPTLVEGRVAPREEYAPGA